MHLSPGDVGIVFVAVLAGALVQGAIGFGMNLVAVPVVALVEPAALPATVVLLGLPLAISMTAHEHHAVDRRGVGWILAGRVPGTFVGVWIVAAVSHDTLSVVVGTSVLLAVGMSLGAPPIPVNPATQAGAGVASGAMGTAAGIGGPPVALLYQHHEGPVMRSTLAATFLFGTILSITMLAVASQVGRDQVLFAAFLLPAVLVGAVLARRFHDALDQAWLRPVVLGFAAVSAVVVVADGLA